MVKPNLLSLLVLLLLTSESDSAWPNDAELRALLTIKRDWGDPSALSSWKNNSNTISHCSWAGVACDNGGQVTALSFPSFHIAQPIPSSICSLKNLTYIDLSYNNLTGKFPVAALYGCSELQFLDLSNNGFSGVLPTDIHKLSPGLEHLNLSTNYFSGSVPSAIAGFPKLKSLLLDTNSFNGSYPGAAIGNLAELETLTLAANPFWPAPIPEEFSRLRKLKVLWLSGMNLTGVIPDALSVLTNLTMLALYDNMLGGEIPAWVWTLQKLEYLYLYANSFVGTIAPNITAVSLFELDLSDNMLTGPIPETIGNLKNLASLHLMFNKITGPIPSSIGLLRDLEDIRLFSNRLSGPLPPGLGKHSPLGNLEVCNNDLSGELPGTLCFNRKLYNIVVFNNSFSGVFPASLGECYTLNNIMAHNNRFAGGFPMEVWSAFPELTIVMIQNNSFTGSLPDKLSPNITRIAIENNRFSGAMPSSAASLATFAADNNGFSRGLPADMTGLARLTELSLAGNQISGFIPQSIVALKLLNYLNLSSNKISGEIPAVLGLLPALTVLDLSNNQLVGEIPEDFNSTRLSFLNLSSNQLVGEVPATLQSEAYAGSFLRNPGLCADSHTGALSLPACSSKGRGHNHREEIILSVAGFSGVSLVGFVAVVAFIRRRKKGHHDVTSWKMIPFRTVDFTELDILSGISEENMVGRGGSGKVYRIHLGGRRKKGTAGAGHQDGGDEAAGGHHATVAVKKIGNSGRPDASLGKEFQAEMRALGGLRHGNIIDLLCCISGGGGATKLLVYEYMENGSLDRWLHRRAAGAAPLGWPARLGVAVDVARGLSYMHHGFARPVVHRDVKSSNILLDREFRAKIADFGLARILAKSGESESASGVCGTFGYIAPEYANAGKVSEKVDVYSFGVVLLELATGRGSQDGGTESGSCLAKWASKRHENNGGACAALVDGEIQDPAYLDDIVAVFELGLACTGEDPSSRPAMSEVLHRLLQCGRNLMSRDDDSAKDVCGFDSFECMA